MMGTGTINQDTSKHGEHATKFHLIGLSMSEYC